VQQLALTALVVCDYEEALGFFVGKLGFHKTADKDMGGGKRWLVVTPPGSSAGLLLARAVGERQEASIGKQSGGRVMFFLHTDDFDRDYHAMLAKSVRFIEAPREDDYGKVVVFEDLYGNKWDLIEAADTAPNRS